MKKPGRIDNAAWRRARATAIAAARGICQLCGYPLRPDAKPRTPWSTSVDHIKPLYLGGDPYAASNLRACHLRCNVRRPRPDVKQQQAQSRIWRSRNW